MVMHWGSKAYISTHRVHGNLGADVPMLQGVLLLLPLSLTQMLLLLLSQLLLLLVVLSLTSYRFDLVQQWLHVKALCCDRR